MIALNTTGAACSPSSTFDRTFDAVLAHLQKNSAVAGLLQIGSAGQPGFSSASDYDLVIVLREADAPWTVGVTWVDGRLTDLIFVAESQLHALAQLDAPVAPKHDLAPLIPWFQSGRIRHDPVDRLHRIQDKLRALAWVKPADDATVHSVWFAINYNLAQTQRMAAASEPLYRAAASVRMAVYGYSDVWFGYFTLRKLNWRGDKAAIAYLGEHDPGFLSAFERFLVEPSAEVKLELYAQAAALATATAGGIWPAHSTAMNVEQSLATWQRLMKD